MKKIFIILILIFILAFSTLVSAGCFTVDMPPPSVCSRRTQEDKWMIFDMTESYINLDNIRITWNGAISDPDTLYYETHPGTIYIIAAEELP